MEDDTWNPVILHSEMACIVWLLNIRIVTFQMTGHDITARDGHTNYVGQEEEELLDEGEAEVSQLLQFY